jgi:hypothetical protein
MSTKKHNAVVEAPMTITPDHQPVWVTLEEFKKIGRPTKLTEELTDTIVKYILRGNYILTCCLAAGVTRQLYYLWMSNAADDVENGLGPEESPLIRFIVTCENARALAEISLVDRVMTRDAFWQRWAWMLERTRPQSFGARQQIEITQDVTVTSVSLPPMTQDYSTWLTQRLQTDVELGRLSIGPLPLDIADADLVDDKERLERVIEDKPLQDKRFGRKRKR